MFDKPRLALALAYVSLPNFAMLALANLSGATLFAWFCESFVGFGSLYILFIFAESELDDRKRMSARDGERVQPEPPATVIRSMGAVVSQFTTPQVKINVEMLFARALIAQSRGLLDVKLTETYWVKSKRWEQLGGVGALDFRDMIARWEKAGAIARKNPNAENSTYIVSDPLKIGRAANGEKLQPLPQRATSPG